MNSTSYSPWMNSEEAARYLGVKRRSLLLRVREGKVPVYALSGTKRRVWRFRKQDLDTVLLSRAMVISETPTVLTGRRK
jgi:excisionase family DNA binding protein